MDHSIEWTKSTTLELIELYKSRPMLWSPEHLFYRDTEKRHNAVVEICEIMGLSKEEIERKIKNIQGQFSRELRKINEGPKMTESKWFGFEPLKFLNQRYKMKRRKVCSAEEIEQLPEVSCLLNQESDRESDRDSPELTIRPRKRLRYLHLNEDKTFDDEFDIAGKKYAWDLRNLSMEQRIICEKLVSEVIYYGRMERLTTETRISLSID